MVTDHADNERTKKELVPTRPVLKQAGGFVLAAGYLFSCLSCLFVLQTRAVGLIGCKCSRLPIRGERRKGEGGQLGGGRMMEDKYQVGMSDLQASPGQLVILTAALVRGNGQLNRQI